MAARIPDLSACCNVCSNSTWSGAEAGCHHADPHGETFDVTNVGDLMD